MILRFADTYELDLDRFELRHDGSVVHVEPQVFDVLAHLVTHRERLVTKEELLDEVWGDRFVSESALTSRLKAARQAVGDDGRTQAVIRTLHGRGYQFHVPVETIETAPRSPSGSRSSIPVPRGSILGRESELSRLNELVDEQRLTTVLGPGGTGKTRLVTEFALGWPEERSAIAFVELAPVVEPTAIADALAGALAIQVGQHVDLRQACVAYLETVEHLVVLDNCEHLIDAVADLLDLLLRSCPDLRVVATSRAPLGLPTEQLFRLDPLPIPAAGTDDVARSAVVALFTRRARRADQDFELDPETTEAVRALCASLDGLPLAVELAAGRLGALELDDVQKRLDRRLDLLSGAPESGEDRHRTLRATLSWSYDLLDPDDQQLLRHLSVFPAGVTLIAAEWIGEHLALDEDPAIVLARLVDASMVIRSSALSGARYSQLETIRAFGIDRLDHHGERRDAESLVVDWARELTAMIDPGSRSADEAEWDDRIRRSLPNLRAARQLMLDRGDLEAAAELSWSLRYWARFRGQSEVWRWCDELYGRRAELTAAWHNRLAAMSSQVAWLRGRLDRAEALARSVVESDATPEELLEADRSLGTVALWQGRFDDAVQHWTASPLDPTVTCTDLASAALAAGYAGDFERARELAHRARSAAVASGVPGCVAWVDYCIGEIEATAGTGRHEDHLDTAISDARRLGLVFMVGVATVTRASHRARAGEIGGAADSYIELIDLWLRSGSITQLWTTLRNGADLLAGVADDTAIRLWAAADANEDASALTGEALERRDLRRAEIVERLGGARVDELEAEAASMERSVLVEDALGALQALTSGPDA